MRRVLAVGVFSIGLVCVHYSVFTLIATGTLVNSQLRTTEDGNVAASWRRTNDGWEKLDHWNLPPSVRKERPIVVELHPLIVALFEMFLALGALTVLSPVDAKDTSRLKRQGCT